MTATDLERLYDDSYWANRKLCQVIARLTPEEFTSVHVRKYFRWKEVTL